MDYNQKHPFEDLTDSQLDEVMVYDIPMTDTSMDNMYNRFQQKRKEQLKMQVHRKRKLMPIIAASLILVLGVTTVYASEISAFIQSLLGKTGVYSTVVDGSAYYLESPVTLDGNRSLSQAMFTADNLELQFRPGWDSPPDLKIKINGEEIEPHGFGGDSVAIYNLTPTDKFDLILDGKSYPVSLISSKAVMDGSKIVEAEPNDITWISMGYKKINGGVQILTTFDDKDLLLKSLVIPEKDTITASFNMTSAHSQREEFMPLIGYDAEGNAYEYQYDTSDMGRPLTMFTSDAPDSKPITLKIPGIVASYDKLLTDLNVTLPAVGEKQEVNEGIDLSLQKMALQSVERISDTTARLVFKLNTGDNDNVRIWSADIVGYNIDNGELLWENGICTMDITLEQAATQINLQIGYPSFIVDGDWTMLIG